MRLKEGSQKKKTKKIIEKMPQNKESKKGYEKATKIPQKI